MRHELFGELTYERDEGAWSGTMPLPRFVSFGRRTMTPDEPSVEEMIADIGEGLSRAMERMSERPMPPVVERLRQAVEEPIRPDERRAGIPGLSAEAEAALDRAADRARADARNRAVGAFFPVRIEAPPDAAPTPAQEAAGRLLIEREDEVCRAILGELLASYRQIYEYEQGRFAAILATEPDEASRARREALQRRYGLPATAGAEGLTAIAHLLKVQIPQSQIDGVSPLIFPVDCDWEQEHGLFLVYHPTLGAERTSFDGPHEYELLDDSATGGD